MTDPRNHRVAELQSRLDEARREILGLRTESTIRRERAAAAMDWIRSRFQVRPDCLWVDEAAQDAVAAHVVVVGQLRAREAELADVREQWADAEAALVEHRGALNEALEQLAAAQGRLDRLRIAALVIRSAAEQMVEATGEKS